jgi:NADH-quinone oxidoreductase subunit G
MTALNAVHAVLEAVPEARVLPAFRRANVVGALQLGLGPAADDRDALETLRLAAEGKLEVLFLLGSDPLSDCPDADLARRALAGVGRIISIDTFNSESTRRADVVLPAAAFGEESGTTTNLEGRVSRVNQKITPHGTSRPDWMIAAELASSLGHDLGLSSVDEVTAAIAALVPAFAGATASAIDSDPEGVLAVSSSSPAEVLPFDEPAAPGYDYRLIVSRKLYDRALGTAMSPSISDLAIGAGAHVHPLDLDRIGEPDGAEVRLVSASGSVVMPLVSDESVQRSTIWAPFNQAGPNISELVDSSAAVTDIRVERL